MKSKEKKRVTIIGRQTLSSKKYIEWLFFIALSIVFLSLIYILFKVYEMDKEKNNNLKIPAVFKEIFYKDFQFQTTADKNIKELCFFYYTIHINNMTA